MRRGDGQVSAPLVPDLFGLCKVLTAAIIWIVQQILYALAGPIPPLAGLGDFLGTDFVITLITWLIVVTVVVLWVTVINLFTIMWVERKLYSRLQDRYGIMISVWSLPFWPFNRTRRPTHRGTGYLQNLADPHCVVHVDGLRRPAVEQRVLRRESGPGDFVRPRGFLPRATRDPDCRLVREQQVHPRRRAARRGDAPRLLHPRCLGGHRARVLHRLSEPGRDRRAAGPADRPRRHDAPDPGVVRLRPAVPRLPRLHRGDDRRDGAGPVRHPRGGGRTRRGLDDGVQRDALRHRLRLQMAPDAGRLRAHLDPLPGGMERSRLRHRLRGEHPDPDLPGGVLVRPPS